MVGPDVRTFLENGEEMLARVRAKIEEARGNIEAQAFYDRHVPVIEHLKIISRHTRKVGMLDDDELDQLQKACAGFGAAFRKAYPKRGGLLTPKGHIVEKHIHYFAKKYGTLGVFGEDGMESLHPLDARARVLVRTMPNLSLIHI